MLSRLIQIVLFAAFAGVLWFSWRAHCNWCRSRGVAVVPRWITRHFRKHRKSTLRAEVARHARRQEAQQREYSRERSAQAPRV